MRSFTVTLFLALFASAAIGLATYQWKQGNFDRIFGKPPIAVGESLYQSFKGDEVARIEIRSGNLEGVFEREDQHWECLTPWKDRMDPVAAQAIIGFSLGLRIEDHSSKDDINSRESGLGSKATHIRLIDTQGKLLAHYKMGRISSWKAEVEGSEQPMNTVFIQPKDELGDKHIYLCTGDISGLFQEDFKLLRDHRPLYFNPYNLQKISIQSQQGEITLGHETPQQAWRIIKPLELLTDLQARNSLINGLMDLRATKVSNRSEVTLPNSGSEGTIRIELTRFTEGSPTVLEIYPPESLEATSLMAVVSDRPDTVFEIPSKPTPGLISLADLPMDVNSLRDPNLIRLNLEALKAISITPSTGPAIVLEVGYGKEPMATINGVRSKANQENLVRLIDAVTSTRASGFESDAASDFSPWGLDRPILALRFLAVTNEAIELRFGMNSKGEFFVNRTGTPTVMKVDGSLIRAITVLPHEWKHSRVWSVDRVNLKRLVVKRRDEEPLILSYDFFEEAWKAQLGTQDVTADLVEARANFLLTQLEGIKSSRWLAKSDPDALTALSDPSLTLAVQEQIVDEDDNVTGNRIRTLIFAPAPQPKHHGYHYGMLRGDEYPFLMDSELYRKLAADLLD